MLIDLAYANRLPLVATNEPFFAARDDYEAHDALICIAEGRWFAESERRQLTPEHYFKTRAEMVALFADLPEALANTVEIAERALLGRASASRSCRASRWARAAASPTRRRAARGRRRTASPPARDARLAPGVTEDDYRERLDFELGVIEQDEVSRLLPDRRRLHPVGQGAGHSGRARAAARAPARWSPIRSPSPTSIRSASTCCSSASSIPTACRCPTSTSISARTAATR